MRKSTFLPAAIVVVVVLLIVARLSIFIVDERQKALVLQFSKIIDVKEQPGIGFKIPFIQTVVRYDDRILSRDIEPLEVTPLDDRRLVVDAFARYRIADIRKFREAVGDGGIPFAEKRLDSILRSQTREVLGSVSSNDILSSDRAALMLRIRNAAIAEAKQLGLDIIDVRLKRTDLPSQNLDETFARMRAEREREAADEVARGNEAAQRVRAQADRTKVEIVSDAKRKAEITRGEADAKSNAIFNQAFGANEKFFVFYRSLDAYRAALKGKNTSIVMSPDSDFFTFFNQSGADILSTPSKADDTGADDTGAEAGVAADSAGDAASGGDTSGTAQPDDMQPSDDTQPGDMQPGTAPATDQQGAAAQSGTQAAPQTATQ